MIIAGEASGDLHAANLVKEALKLDPSLSFFGIGGPRMREAGVDTLVDSSEMAVVGLVEVISHFKVIYSAFSAMKNLLRTTHPDLLILIDYPDFNLRLAKIAKEEKVKVLYYISPQIWAWRVGRVKKIARLVDRMAVVFPFEVPFYEKEAIPVDFVGHPLVDTVLPEMSRPEAQKRFGLEPEKVTLGLFPGSRRQEIRNLFPVILESAGLLKKRFPDLQLILPLASSLQPEDLQPALQQSGLDVKVIEGSGYDVMQVCDAGIAVSGTVTLEMALLGIPMVIIYKVSPLTYAVGRHLIRVEHIGLCNIVAGERIVRELIQDDVNPETIADEISRIINDHEYVESIKAKLSRVRSSLGTGGSSRAVAEIAIGMIARD